MRPILLVSILLTLSASTITTASVPDPHKPTRRNYVRHTFGAPAIGKSAAGAGIQQLRHSPKEWGQGAGGFAKRLGSGFGTHVVNNTIHYGVSSWRHEEVGYRPSDKTGFGPRMKYALMSTVVTRKTTSGKKTVATGELSGAFGSGMISRAWQPASTCTVASGAATGGVILGVDAGTHVIKEFWPEIRHPLGRHASKRVN